MHKIILEVPGSHSQNKDHKWAVINLRINMMVNYCYKVSGPKTEYKLFR